MTDLHGLAIDVMVVLADVGIVLEVGGERLSHDFTEITKFSLSKTNKCSSHLPLAETKSITTELLTAVVLLTTVS